MLLNRLHSHYKKLLTSLALLLTLSLALITTSTQNAYARADKTTITLGIDYWPGYYPAIIAKHLGYFSDYNLNVNIKIYSETDRQLNDFKSGRLNAICAAAGDIIPLYNHSIAQKIILVTDLSAGGDAIIANSSYRKDSKNLSIGIDSEGFGEIFVNEFITNYKLNKDLITLVNIDPTKAKQALDNNTVDMAHTWDPHLSEAVNKGAKIIFTSRQTPGLIPDVLTFSTPFIEQHPEAVKNFIKAWFKGLNWWMSHKAEANNIITEKLQLTEKIQLKNLKLMSLEDNIKSFSNTSPRALPSVLKTYIDYFYDKGQLKKEIIVDDIIDSRHLSL